MKKYFILLILFAVKTTLYSQSSDDKNIISYYAVGNSLDGQPLIDKENALRFFPVFKFRDATQSVKVRVYVGSLIWDREAIESSDRTFWQADLPDFKLGEAIQRLEVETKIQLDTEKMERVKSAIDEVDKKIKDAGTEFDKRKESLVKAIDTLIIELKKLPDIKNKLSSIDENYNKYTDTAFIDVRKKLDAIKNLLSGDPSKLKESIDEFDNSITELIKIPGLDENLKIELDNILNLTKRIDTLKVAEEFERVSKTVTASSLDLNKEEEAIKQKFVDDMQQSIGDTNVVGPQVRPADIIFEDGYKFVRILYRNYKTTLRQLPALDPAEKLGIFRIRYIPFPIVGKKLYRPYQDNSEAVFEVGLGFGNVAISGDDFVKPTLSFDRLGVAFAISNRLFSDSAKILALVLTYDFNVYGSIGVGANFKTTDDPENDKIKPYFSFGINKKAFELLISSIGKFFGSL